MERMKGCSAKSTVLAIGLAACIWAVLPTSSLANHAWGPYHWARTTKPFILKLGNNLTGKWPPYLSTATNNWNSVIGGFAKVIRPVIIPGRAGAGCRAVVGTTQVCNGAYGRTGWVGLARIWMDGRNHVTQGTAQMNDSYFGTPAQDTATGRMHVVCHEVGHTFGLGHQSETGASLGTCLDYSNSPRSTGPNSHDFYQLALRYQHLDNVTTTRMPEPSADLEAATGEVNNDPKSWGELVQQSPDGEHSIYERTSHGIDVITHVHWVKEVAEKCEDLKCDHRFNRER